MDLTTDAEFVAIFDADFVPRPDFLKRRWPFLDRPKIGLVQGRWTSEQEFLIDHQRPGNGY